MTSPWSAQRHLLWRHFGANAVDLYVRLGFGDIVIKRYQIGRGNVRCCQRNPVHTAAKSFLLLVLLLVVGHVAVRCSSFLIPVIREMYLCRVTSLIHKFCFYQCYLMFTNMRFIYYGNDVFNSFH